MRKPILLLLGGVFLATSLTGISCAQTKKLESSTPKLISYQDRIKIDYLRKHLSALAADSMEGRETGMPGQKKAARYLAEEYTRLGLKPVGDDGSYFQNFELSALQRDSIVYSVYRLGEDGKSLADRSVESSRSSGNFIRSFGGSDTLSGEIVFAGFGINDTGRGIGQLEGMDLEGKWVMVYQELPGVTNGDTLYDPSFNGRTRFESIMARKQAAGMLLIPPMSDTEFDATAEKYQLVYGQPGSMSLKYLDDSGGGFSGGYNLVQPSFAAKLLGLKGGAEELSTLRVSLLGDLAGFKPRSTGYSLTHTPYVSELTVETENVAAYIEGVDDSLKDEVVVLTSHYDHVGIGQPDSTGDRIYNGADDDGSGTVALMNVADALMQARSDGYGTRRSILILHVSGEEKGLLGSRYYSDHPIFPMEKTIANINIDMIGRIDPEHEKKGISEYAYIIGSEIISSEMDSLLKVANSKSGNIELDKSYNDLEDPNQFYRRSDHWNFGRFGIPFVFFFTGVHEDYHRPSDEIEKIRFDKMAKIIRTIYATTVTVANETEPPEVDNQEFIEITKSNPR